MKSILVFLNQRVPKTHDLDMLKNLVPPGWTVSNFTSLADLSFWAVESRYPGSIPEATSDDADAALALAEKVLLSVHQDLHTKGFRA